MNHSVLWLVMLSAAVMSPCRALAESDYFDLAQRQFDDAAAGSFDQLEAVLKMTEASYFIAMPDALLRCDQATVLAETLGDTNAEAACLMYRAIILGWMNETPESEKAFRRAESLFDIETATAFYKCHYFSAFVRYELMLGEGSRDIDRFLCNWRDAAFETEDHVLIVQCLICQTFDLVMLGGRDPESPLIKTAIQSLAVEAPLAGLERDAEAFMSLIEAQIANKHGDRELELARLLHAADLSQESGCALIEAFFRSGAARILSGREEARLALPHLERNLELMRRLACDRSLMVTLVRISECHQALEELQTAREYLDEAVAIELGGLHSSAAPLQVDLYRVAMELAYRERDLDQVRHFGLKATSAEFLDRLALSSGNYVRMKGRIVELEQSEQQAQQHRETLQRKLATKQMEAHRKIRLLQMALTATVAVVGVLMLLAALVYSRRKLGEARRQLSDEQQCSRRDKKIRENLEQSVHRLQRMESLGILAGGVAHDFNNLLVGVICNAELLQQRSTDDQFASECLEQVIQAAEKAAGLSRQMLAYAGKQRIEKAPLDLNELVKALLNVLQATVGDDVQICMDVSDQLQTTLCDATQIEQVVLNLVTNARDSSAKGAEVMLRTGRECIDTVDEAYVYGSRLEGGTFAYVEVQDMGSGIAESSLEHIFEPFYSGRGSGRGLGLAVVYGIVEAHNGLIRVTSTPGAGTTVRVLLPISLAVPAASASRPAPLNDSTRVDSSTAPLVLVVDDEPTVLDFAKRLLVARGWDVLLASDGRGAMRLIHQHHDRISCILLDVVMPRMDASGVLDEMNRCSLNTPVVLMSGFSEMQLDKYREYSQVVEIVEKPFRSSEIIGALRAVRDRLTSASLSDEAARARTSPTGRERGMGGHDHLLEDVETSALR